MSIIYEVNLKIQTEIKDQYRSWLKEHIKEILKIDGFVKAQWFLRRPEDEGQPKDDNFVLWTIQYTLRDRPAIDNYIAHHAPKMRQEGIERFGNKFSAQRRILELEETFG